MIDEPPAALVALVNTLTPEQFRLLQRAVTSRVLTRSLDLDLQVLAERGDELSRKR